MRLSGWAGLMIGAATVMACPATALAHDASTFVVSARKTYNLNPDWRMLVGDPVGGQHPGFDDSAWRAVTLPNAFNEKEAFARDIRELSTGITWYRKRFMLPDDRAEKAFVEFEGVRQAAEVWVNGQPVILSEHGAMAFGADITAALRPGENVIAVRVDSDWDYKERASGSGFQWNDRNFNVNYGGITRNVRLHVAGPVYQTLPLYSALGTTGQYVWADGFDVEERSATIHADTEVRNDGDEPRTISLQVEIRDPDGKLMSRFDGSTTTLRPGEKRTLHASKWLAGLNFWSWGYGYLYTVTTSLIERGRTIDSVDTATGFRQTRFRDGMIELNGRVIQVHGYAQRTSNEWPAIGVSVPPWISDFSNALMVESGGNLVRWMHIAPSKQDIESADRVGLLQAMPAGEDRHTHRRAPHRPSCHRLAQSSAILAHRPGIADVLHEGPWHKVDRIWTIRTDGTGLTKIHTRTMNMEIAGHEFWAPDGKTIWYDLQTPRGEVFWLAGYEIETGKRRWYKVERDQWSVHFNISPDQTVFSGDGGDSEMVAHAKDGKWLYLFRPRDIPDVAGIHAPDSDSLIAPGVLDSEKLVDLSGHDYRLEPNAHFTPDGKWLVYRSNIEGPDGGIYAVEIAKAAPQ